MPIDRDAILRKAEKLLRQGKLEPAIAEYLQIVEAQPRDWNTANTLGDLYVRAGQTDKAVEQFSRIADGLKQDGFVPKAAALYKKILKISPDDDRALLGAGELAAQQGLLADARGYFATVMGQRRSRGDRAGAAQIQVRLGTLDPNDFAARVEAARARAQLGDVGDALSELKQIAAELTEKGRQSEAIEALREAALVNPDDDEIREGLLEIYLATGDYDRARECAALVDQFKRVAAALEAAGRSDDALGTLQDAVALDPTDAALKADLARAFQARGDLKAAAEYLTVEIAGDDPALLLALAELQLRTGQMDDGLGIIGRLLGDDPSRREAVALLGWNLAEEVPDAGYALVEAASEVSIGQSDWGSAAAALQEFVTRVPNHVPALMRLVEICIDAGLEATMFMAQAQLADAYLAAGAASEARVIAEDLVAREPWERANIERFRRALTLLGEPDADRVIAERLSGETPFTSTDLSIDELPTPPEPEFVPEAVPQVPLPPVSQIADTASQGSSEEAWPVDDQPPAAISFEEQMNRLLAQSSTLSKAAPPRGVAEAGPPVSRAGRRTTSPSAESDRFDLNLEAFDLGSLMGDLQGPKASAAPAPAAGKPHEAPPEHEEIDLSVDLASIKPAALTGLKPTAPMTGVTNIEGVFDRLRDEASRQSPVEAAEREYRRGLQLREQGQIEESLKALEAASRAPTLRFQAASLMGRIYRDRGMMPQAIECFERAAQAPALEPDEGHRLLYDLASALESTGEVDRALAIWLELQADAGEYRDVSARVNKLAKVQRRG